MATPAARTASPGILMLALLLTATSAPARKPAPTGTAAHPQPAKQASQDSTTATAPTDDPLRCL